MRPLRGRSTARPLRGRAQPLRSARSQQPHRTAAARPRSAAASASPLLRRTSASLRSRTSAERVRAASVRFRVRAASVHKCKQCCLHLYTPQFTNVNYRSVQVRAQSQAADNQPSSETPVKCYGGKSEEYPLNPCVRASYAASLCGRAAHPTRCASGVFVPSVAAPFRASSAPSGATFGSPLPPAPPRGSSASQNFPSPLVQSAFPFGVFAAGFGRHLLLLGLTAICSSRLGGLRCLAVNAC